ncbi:neuropeptide-like 2 [Drosophila bipectinata]|uniref:neuropeptide-like 2 n=1 Tax=Drosophila bipectinata TaxID=42026 RepID=UPI0038B2869B
MAKIAVIFLPFALFAITMGASVPQEESSDPSKLFVKAENEGLEYFNKLVLPKMVDEDITKFQDAASKIRKTFEEAVQNIHKEVEKSLKRAP